MARKTKKQLATGAGWGWFKKSFNKVKNHVKKHVKKHAKRAIAHGKKAARAAAKQAKAAAISAGKELLEQAKEEGKQMLADTIADATEAATSHVRKHVCSKVGSGFYSAQKKQLIKMAHKEMDAVHRKGIAHVRSGGRKGSGLDDHVNKARARIDGSVDRIKNKAKSRIRAMAGCDDEGEGFSTRGAGWAGNMLRAKYAKVKRAAAKKKGSGLRMRGAGYRKKKCTCH